MRADSSLDKNNFWSICGKLFETSILGDPGDALEWFTDQKGLYIFLREQKIRFSFLVSEPPEWLRGS